MPSKVRAVGRGVFWALTWGAGTAIGVAAGAWLTAVGGTGAPGLESIDTFGDLVVLPLLAGGAVVVAHLAGQGVVAVVRRARSG